MLFAVATIVLFVWEQSGQRCGDGRIDDRGSAQSALVVMPLVGQEMPFSGLTANDFPAPGLCETLTRPFMRLHFHCEILFVEQSPCGTSMFRSDDHDQAASFHTRSILNGAGLGQLFNDGIHHRATHLLVGHFSTPIGEGDLGLVAFL